MHVNESIACKFLEIIFGIVNRKKIITQVIYDHAKKEARGSILDSSIR